MTKILRSYLVLVVLALSCTPPSQQPASSRPAASTTDPESFPVTFSFLDNGKPTPVRAYFQLNGQPFLVDSLGWRLPITVDYHYHDRAFPLKPSIPVLDMTYNGEHHWYFVTGRATLPMLPGNYVVDVYKGTEFRPLHLEFELTGDEREKKFELERWIDLASEGWYGGDDHIHLSRQPADDQLYLGLLEADGLSVGHFLQLQRREQAAVQYAWGAGGQAGRDGYIIRSGEEQRSHFYGHNIMLGIDSLVRPVSQGLTYGLTATADPLTEKLFAEAHRLGGTVGYAHDDGGVQHSAAMIDLAHGDIDFLEVFQFGGMRARFWYDALSCGFRIPGTAGSDFPYSLDIRKPWQRLIPPFGPDRMYVHVDGPLTFDKWMAGLRAGDIVLTDGPFIDFSVEGEPPGSETNLSPGAAGAEFTARVRHWRPPSRAELIVNGRVAKTYTNTAQAVDWKIDSKLVLGRSAWIALHVVTDATDGDPDGPRLEAHTNPVYVLLDGRPVGAPDALNDEISRLERMRAYFGSDSLEFTFESSRLRLLERADYALKVLRERLEE